MEKRETNLMEQLQGWVTGSGIIMLYRDSQRVNLKLPKITETKSISRPKWVRIKYKMGGGVIKYR